MSRAVGTYNSNFIYVVKILDNVQSFMVGPVDDALGRGSEMVITSRPFNNYLECITTVNNLLTGLSNAREVTTGQSYVLVIVKNPLFDAGEAGANISPEKWDATTLARIYLADSLQLKNAVLAYSVFAEIKLDIDTARASYRLMHNFNEPAVQ